MSFLRIVLLSGAALGLSAGLALAQMEPPPPAPDMYGDGPMRGRLAERALKDFDVNRDGKITRDEVGWIEAKRFRAASGGAQEMTAAQFAKAHEKFFAGHVAHIFHSLDWNGDGVLSLDEYRAPLRARFEHLDRDANGALACGPAKGSGHRRSGGIAALCRQANFNKDAKLDHGEFDKAVAERYAAAVKGGKGLTLPQYQALEWTRFEAAEARRFKRLDKNGNGKLELAEFAAPGVKLFGRLDRNHDGVLTQDELAHPARAKHAPRKARTGKAPGRTAPH